MMEMTVTDTQTEVSQRVVVSEETPSQRRRKSRMRHDVVTAILLIAAALFLISDVSLGNRVYGIDEIVQALSGSATGGVTFSIMELRLPRALVACACGAVFGIAGVSFQTLLGNVLASPDVVGITAGANLAAVFAITVVGTSGTVLFGFAVGGGLAAACMVLLLSWNRGLAGSRFILVGIGVAAVLNALTSWLMVRANQWDVQAASRWLTGSLADARWEDVFPVTAALALGGLVMVLLSRHLDVLRFGSEVATGLGVRVNLTRACVIVVAVVMLSIATATTGPIAFVSFLSGPLALRIVGAEYRTPIIAAGAVGASIVLLADIAAQHLPSGTVPVGVMTSLVGGPALVAIIVLMMRKEA